MSAPLDFLSWGAVTPVGLDAEQSCAAIRAGIKRLTPIERAVLPTEEPRLGARISAAPGLRRSPDEWLLNLACRALGECIDQPKFAAERAALFLLVPEAHRAHELAAREDAELLAAVHERLGLEFHPRSRVLREGAGALVAGLGHARELLAERAVDRVLIGGADSLLRVADLERFEAVGRLYRPDRPQGLIPGEAAGFVMLGRRAQPPRTRGKGGKARKRRPRIGLAGLGLGYERETVIEGGSSVGDGLVAGFENAIAEAGFPEAEIQFVASNYNGERYAAWESSHAHARCYRSRRERLPQLQPVVSTGEAGVAGGVVALIAAIMAIRGGWAPGEGPGKVAAIEASSEGEARGVAIIRARL